MSNDNEQILDTKKTEQQLEENKIITDKEKQQLTTDFIKDPNIVKSFSVSADKFQKAVDCAVEEILSRAKTEEEKENYLNLIQKTAAHISELPRHRNKQFVHGTGTDALFSILKQGKIVRRGSEYGGADVEMGHNLSKTENGEEETYISVSENSPMGYSLSYSYARGFERSETKALAFDANTINGLSAQLEQWDALSNEEQQYFEEKYKFNRERIESSSERPHYYNSDIEKEKILIYQHVIDVLRTGKIPETQLDIDDSGEIQHLIGKVSNNEIFNRIFLKIKNDKNKWPDSTMSEHIGYYIKDYQKLLDRTKERLEKFQQLPPNEQKEKTHQYPVVLTLEKSEINGTIRTTFIDEKGDEQPIHPSQQELRIYNDFNISAISAIQAPKIILPKIKEAIDRQTEETEDIDLKKNLQNIILIPLELYEVERIIQKKVNEYK